jgi:hypothetical protein
MMAQSKWLIATHKKKRRKEFNFGDCPSNKYKDEQP